MVVSKKGAILLIIWWGDRPDQQKNRMQYQYDADHRFTAATGEPNFQYSYDAVGNLLTLNRNGSSTKVTPNMLNQVAIAGANQYLYDANGNLLNDGKYTYAWDAANRLIHLTDLASGHVTTFAYNGFSRRITRTETDTNGNNTVVHNLWCGQRLCAQFNSSGAIARYFPQGQMKDGTAYLYARNQVGSVVAMVGLDGQVKGRTDYGPYGHITNQSGIQPDFAYAGLYRHQHSGLYLATYRAYNPAIGRWLNRDPIKEAGGINLYGYVMGNPVAFIDLLGLEWVTIGHDYQGTKNWLLVIGNRLATLGSNKVMSTHNCIGCTRDVIQKWRVESRNDRMCKKGVPRDGELRKIRQVFGAFPDPWAVGGKSWSWFPAVPNDTSNEWEPATSIWLQ